MCELVERSKRLVRPLVLYSRVLVLLTATLCLICLTLGDYPISNGYNILSELPDTEATESHIVLQHRGSHLFH